MTPYDYGKWTEIAVAVWLPPKYTTGHIIPKGWHYYRHLEYGAKTTYKETPELLLEVSKSMTRTMEWPKVLAEKAKSRETP